MQLFEEKSFPLILLWSTGLLEVRVVLFLSSKNPRTWLALEGPACLSLMTFRCLKSFTLLTGVDLGYLRYSGSLPQINFAFAPEESCCPYMVWSCLLPQTFTTDLVSCLRINQEVTSNLRDTTVYISVGSEMECELRQGGSKVSKGWLKLWSALIFAQNSSNICIKGFLCVLQELWACSRPCSNLSEGLG